MLRQPSAVVVLAPGVAYAVLDRAGIWIYDVRADTFQPQVTFSHEQYRGTGEGVTLGRYKRAPDALRSD